MRSQGQVRFLTVTTRMQIFGAAALATIVLGVFVSIVAMALFQWQASQDRDALLTREARVATQEERFQAYSDDLVAETANLERRQDFLESMLPMLPEDLLAEAEAAEAEGAPVATEDSAELISMIESAIPEAAGLARIEQRQIAYVELLTTYANRRAERTEKAIRSLGLDPRVVMVRDTEAMGGPLEKLVSDADGSLDPRFGKLAKSLVRLSSLERGLAEIPQVMPADMRNISSGFGPRSDPFSGEAAMHKGLDFRGPQGAPILAAADGRVSFVGTKAGYGRVVEISHGNGMMTRYAHMSRQIARVGQLVDAGDEIGKIGSTGRSTGPHLHFEVHINGRAVNPRPFLETAPDVLEEARAEFTSAEGNARG